MQNSKRIVTLTEMRERLGGITREGLRKRINAGGFPKPIRTPGGKTIGWTEDQYDKWVAENTEK